MLSKINTVLPYALAGVTFASLLAKAWPVACVSGIVAGIMFYGNHVNKKA